MGHDTKRLVARLLHRGNRVHLVEQLPQAYLQDLHSGVEARQGNAENPLDVVVWLGGAQYGGTSKVRKASGFMLLASCLQPVEFVFTQTKVY